MRRIFYMLLLGGFSIWGNAQTPATDGHWKLVFEDDFNALNTNIWKVADHFDHYGEPQVHRAQNVYIENDNLVLEVKKEPYCCPDQYVNESNCKRQYVNSGRCYDYTSGYVETKKAYSKTQNGYIEARIKLPYGRGFWPAFWTWRAGGVPNPHNVAEIDIFEMLGHQPSTIMGTNLHLGYCCEGCGVNCSTALHVPKCVDPNSGLYCYQIDAEIPSYANTYHIYAVEWTPTKIMWYVDGKNVRTFPNPGIVDPVKIILNVAIYSWPLPDITTPFPSKMYVDYVRVYQLQYDDAVINSCTYNFNSYNNRVKKNIKIGGNGCVNAISSGNRFTIRATESIEINGDFYVPLGAEIYMDANPATQ